MCSKLLRAYFDDKDMKWEKLKGICTDGTSAMLVCRIGFITRMKQNSPSAVGIHYVIHREIWLPRLSLSAAMKDKFAIVIRVVNFIKASLVNTKLFAK